MKPLPQAFALRWVAQSDGAITEQRLALPVGVLRITRQAEVIIGTEWDSAEALSETEANLQSDWLAVLGQQPLSLLEQGSVYRRRVWAALLTIPCGSTVTYAALAKNLGSAARAVGNACRDNPYALLIPCHRVVAANSLGGYCGATQGHFMRIKSRLLAWEAEQSVSG